MQVLANPQNQISMKIKFFLKPPTKIYEFTECMNSNALLLLYINNIIHIIFSQNHLFYLEIIYT